MPDRKLPTEQEVQSWIRERRNWGRWGKDDQLGAINLITPAKRAAAARLVRTGRSVSLSRPFPKDPGPNNPLPAHHFMRTHPRGKGGFSADYYGIYYHGIASTHIDALCHTWDDDAMWNGRDPKKEITFEGARFGSVEHWAEGIMTRAVMLDVPRHRGVPCVTHDTPVHGWELDDILTKRGIKLEPGDAVCVYSGREAWQAQDPERPYGRPFNPTQQQRPGLHVSCLPFLRDHDVSVLAWDMLDHLPIGYDIPWAVHAAIFAYGVALVDNALLEPLAKACIEEQRDEFMLLVSPLRVVGGTGSPANPLAMFGRARNETSSLYCVHEATSASTNRSMMAPRSDAPREWPRVSRTCLQYSAAGSPASWRWRCRQYASRKASVETPTGDATDSHQSGCGWVKTFP